MRVPWHIAILAPVLYDGLLLSEEVQEQIFHGHLHAQKHDLRARSCFSIDVISFDLALSTEQVCESSIGEDR